MPPKPTLSCCQKAAHASPSVPKKELEEEEALSCSFLGCFPPLEVVGIATSQRGGGVREAAWPREHVQFVAVSPSSSFLSLMGLFCETNTHAIHFEQGANVARLLFASQFSSPISMVELRLNKRHVGTLQGRAIRKRGEKLLLNFFSNSQVETEKRKNFKWTRPVASSSFICFS